MPTYDFRCKTCGTQFEITRSFTEDGTPDCPQCAVPDEVIKVFPKVGISFKGSGFYKNDSRGGSSKSASSSGSSESSGATSSGSSDSSSSSTAAATSSSGSDSSNSSSAGSSSSGSPSTSSTSAA